MKIAKTPSNKKPTAYQAFIKANASEESRVESDENGEQPPPGGGPACAQPVVCAGAAGGLPYHWQRCVRHGLTSRPLRSLQPARQAVEGAAGRREGKVGAHLLSLASPVPGHVVKHSA